MAASWSALFGRKNEASVPNDGSLRTDAIRTGSFRRAFAKAPDAAALFDGDLVAEVNAAWERLFCRSEDACVGQSLSLFLPEAGWEGEGTFANREFTGI